MEQTLPITGTEVEALIPQRHPFVAVDTLFRCTENECESGFTPPENHLLSGNGYFTEFGLTENMAQTGALHSGYLSKLHGTPPAVGFIGQIKNLKIHFLPKTKDSIRTRIEHLHKVANVSVIRAEVSVGERLCAECEMKIFLQNPAGVA
jgi:predicted hotdog family 3-hydroxylacyl-ACP dehydratase